jgi:hypothetical protein
MTSKSRLPKDEQERTLLALRKHESLNQAALFLGIGRSTLRARMQSMGVNDNGDPFEKSFKVQALPETEEPVEDLIERRIVEFKRRNIAHEARKLINVSINIDGPIGITHFGDPHVDDDGCDWPKLKEDITTVKNAPGMFGGNVGDMQNNWIGRLARLYAEQGTTATQAWRMVEWMVNEIPWLYMIGGNHDAWSGSGDPLKWITRQADILFQYDGCRLNLCFPNGKQVRINARHDFSGHSMWNPVHGPMKAAQGGWRDHILTCGHKHVSFMAGPLKDPSNGLLTWVMRPAGYKKLDHYASEKGLPDQNAFASGVTIIDPQFADDDTKLITVIPDVQEGAEFLGWKRSRAGV